MGVEYTYNTGYGFLLPRDKFAFPAEWDSWEMWYEDGEVNKALAGSGVSAIIGGADSSHWGFMATDTIVRMSKWDSEVVREVHDIDPAVVSNLYDIRARVKRPKVRVGWTMWADIG